MVLVGTATCFVAEPCGAILEDAIMPGGTAGSTVRKQNEKSKKNSV